MAQPRASDVAKAMHLHYCWSGCAAGLMVVLSSADAASTSIGATPDEVVSALTDRYQTTVPQPVRRALGLRKRDRIRYAFRANGEVVLQRVSPDPLEEDPALAPFLALLERDIASHPERLQPIGADLVQRLQDLVGAIEVNLDEALPDDEPA
jgi:antitoxin PrlF